MDRNRERTNHPPSENTFDQYQRSVQFVLQSVSQRYKILLFISALTVLITGLHHLFYIPTYEARSVVRVQTDQKVSVPILLANQQAGMGYMPDSREMPRYVRYLQSETFLTIVAEKVKSSPDYNQVDLTDPKKIAYFGKTFWKHFFSTQAGGDTSSLVPVTNIHEMVSKIAQLVRVDIENVEMISVTVNSFNTKTSTVIANAFVEEFARMNLINDAQEIVEVEKFIESKLEEVKQSLKNGEINMVALKERNHMYTTESNGMQVTDQMKEIDRKQSELWIQEAENNSKLKLIQSNSDIYQGADKEVRDFKLSELKKKNDEILRQRTALGELAHKAEVKFSKLPKAEQEYFALKRQEQVDFELYSSLVQKLNQLEIQKYSIQKKVIIEALASGASPAARTSVVLKLLFALFASLFFGVVGALLSDWIDPTIKCEEDLVAARIENIGVIPRIAVGESESPSPKRKGVVPEELGLSRMLITRENPRSIESMSFKYIRARLQKILDKSEDQCKVILVTSATSGDGKSFVSCNLAVSFAQLGKRTLLIDGDFRNPSINKYFDIPNRIGLASVLKMEHSLDDVIVQDDVVPALHVIPADWGIEDPTELVSDEKMVILLEHLKQEFDYIIIDSPPIQMVVDGLILSSLATNVLVIGRYRHTLKRLLGKTYSDLINVHYQKIFGILNDAEQSRLLKFFGDHGMIYGNLYGYGYGKGQSKYFPEQGAASEGAEARNRRAKKAS